MFEFEIENGVLLSVKGEGERLTVPDGPHTVGVDALADTNGVVEVILPPSVSRIERYAFRKKGGIKNISFLGRIDEICYGAFEHCIGLTELDLSRGVRVIGNNAFYSCMLLGKVILSGCDVISESAFEGCVHVKEYEVIGECKYKTVDGALYRLGAEGELETLVQYPIGKVCAFPVIPDGVRFIGDHAFAYSHLISGITVPESVKRIGRESFKACSNLFSVKILNKKTEVGFFAFEDCRYLNGN